MPSRAKTDIERILDQGLLFHCFNWGDSGCRPAIKEFFDFERPKVSQTKTRRLPTFDELDKFNEICRKCPKASLEINKKECPVCGSHHVVEGFAHDPDNNDDERPPVLYQYYCVDCGKQLFSGLEL